MDVLKLIILVIVLMAFVVAALATKILLKKGGEFPNTHIGGNKYLKSKGISCAQTEDKIEQAKARKELRFKKIFLDESDTIGSC
ncbi:MAG: hypothetical protein K0M40_17285 [Prolixibacteraceae bacterium]|nr:hypothetical protein [Prolixibacteraceae bacterium]